MGRRKGLYKEEFPLGTTVRIRDRAFLEDCRRRWKWHNPLEDRQMHFAGHEGRVKDVGFYHGGDELYQIAGIPGTWHEECLEAVAQTP